MTKHKLPDVIGWFLPADRKTDYTGDLINPITGEVTHPPTMTKQEFVAECDINNIVKEYMITGQIAHINAKAAEGAFMDLPDDLDFQNSMNTVLRAQQAFSDLPSQMRARFENDPEKFLAFMSNAENQEEMITLGLAKDLRPPAEPLAPSGARPEPGAPPLVPDR